MRECPGSAERTGAALDDRAAPLAARRGPCDRRPRRRSGRASRGGLRVERRAGHPAPGLGIVRDRRLPCRVVGSVRLHAAVPGRAVDRGRRLPQLRVEWLGRRPDGRGGVPGHLGPRAGTGPALAARRGRHERRPGHRLATVRPDRGAARGVRRSRPGRLVQLHRPGAHAARGLPAAPAAAGGGRGLDGGRRRVLADRRARR